MSQPTTDRRGEVLTIAGGLLCIAAFVVLLLISLYGESTAVFAAAWLALGMLGIWVVTGVQVHQQRLLDEERLELAELERARRERLGGPQRIFDETDLDQMEALSMGRRLRTIEKWFVPVGALLTAAYLVFVGVRLLPGRWSFDLLRRAAGVRGDDIGLLAAFAGGAAFAAFVHSRWALGWARLPEFRLLRAGGNGMMGVALSCFAAAVALLAVKVLEAPAIERGVATGIGVLCLVLAAETAVNFVLSFYRPRVAGVEPRSFYDSRLLGMFSEPGGLLKSVADAVDYQFGFKVSETWFYRLLERWIVPLVIVQAVVLWLLTGVVVVPQGHVAVIERLGLGRAAVTLAQPGLALTWPWPFDRAVLIPVERVRRVELGYADKPPDASTARKEASGPELWSVKHRREEYGLLVPDRSAAADESLPLNLLSVTIPIQWRVRADQVERFYRQAYSAPRFVEATAYQVLTQFSARSDLLDLLSTGGTKAAEEIRRELQAALDAGGYDGGGLGVEVVHVSLANIHPVTAAAEAYEEVVNAFQQKEARVRRAEGEAHRLMVSAGGLEYQALYDAIVAEEQATGRATGGVAADPAKAAAASREVERMLQEVAGGEARRIIAEAVESAYRRVAEETARAELFEVELAAYQRAPEIYVARRYLQALEDAFQGVRKYIIALEDSRRVLVEFEEGNPVPTDLINQTLKGLEGAKP